MKTKKNAIFNAQAFLDSAGVARKIVEYRRGEVMFTQAILANTCCTSRRVT
jgi:hypothetical protein